MTSTAQIARNTLYLYFRLIFTVGVTLYAIRVVLNALGAEDFGVYTVVGGIVALLSFLPAAMASATQRYFSFALGSGDREKLMVTFTVNCILYGAIAILALVALESAGLWYVSSKLRVPADRTSAVVQLFHFSTATLVVGIFTSPFMAIIIAHEDMKTYAYISIGEAMMKLASALLLTRLPGDKLPLYGFLLMSVSAINAIVYIRICAKRYEECQFRTFYWNASLLREIVEFTSWTLFGQLTTAVRNHAVTILMNQMFNPAVVAARAIALNVGGQTSMFSQSFNVSLYPPIIKTYASGQLDDMHALVFSGAKITFFLTWIFALPLFVNMEWILNTWLTTPPPDTVLFARLALIEALIFSVSMPLTTAARAPGNMRFYELTLGAMQLAIFPMSWGALKSGGEPSTVFAVAIAVNLLMFVARLLIVRGLIGMSALVFSIHVVVPVFIVIVLSSTGALLLDRILPEGGFFSALSALCNLLVCCLLAYAFGLDDEWRRRIRSAVTRKLLGRG